MKLERNENESESDWTWRQIKHYNRQSKQITIAAGIIMLVSVFITILGLWRIFHKHD